MQVTFGATVEQFKELVRSGDIDGTDATVRYDSAFGGVQEVDGTVDVNEKVLSRDTAVIGGREIDGRRVLSAGTGRTLGGVVEVEVTVDKETAIETVTRHWGGHDVDDGEGESYVQMWENNHTAEVTLTHA